MEVEEKEVEVESIRVSAILLADLPTDPMGICGGVEAPSAHAEDRMIAYKGAVVRSGGYKSKVGIDG